MVPAKTNDGRYIDPALGALAGEGAQQQVKPRDERMEEIAPKPWNRVPLAMEQDPTYYERPLLKPSVWGIDIPLYYFVGGAAGAALSIGAAVQLACIGDPCRAELRHFSAHCHWVGIIGSTVGAALLIHDLGKPSRFFNMVRVFRPTSPMNMGAWILGGAAPTAIATGLFINRGGLLGVIGETTGYLAGGFGTALAGYTGVLVSSSAIPVWQQARRWMPVLFMASAMTSAASLLDLWYEDERANRITGIFGAAGRIGELVASRRVESAASEIPKVGEPFRKGATSILWKASTALTAASLVLSLVPAKSRRTRQVAGVLGALGSLALRFAVYYITNASARDPRASFQLQRAKPRSAESGSASAQIVEAASRSEGPVPAAFPRPALH